MLRRTLMLEILLVAAVLASAQTQPMPQTARQALIEMFFGKAPGTFEKHLPEATLAAVRKADPGSGASMLSAFSMISGQMHANGQQFESFDAGPILFTTENPQAHSKLEVIVERDDLRGDTDEIELSFRAYKDGQLQTAGIDPRLTVAIQPEKKTWRLYDIKLSVGVSLTDPNFLKLLTTPVRPPVTSVTSTQAPGGPTANFSGLRASNETSAVASVRAINTAQASYSAAYPAHGFTCNLSDLGGLGGGSGADEHHAMLLDPRLSSGRKNGYIFKLANCNGDPATTYSVTAAPADANAGTRAFCSDQAAAIRYSQDGSGESCLSAGQPLH